MHELHGSNQLIEKGETNKKKTNTMKTRTNVCYKNQCLLALLTLLNFILVDYEEKLVV
jgi:hypothetical protein